MRDDLDELIGRLAATSPDHSLTGLEEAVLSGVARERSARRAARALAPAQLAAIVLAAGVGLTAGGALGLSAVQAMPAAGGMLSTTLAPSSLLVASR